MIRFLKDCLYVILASWLFFFITGYMVGANASPLDSTDPLTVQDYVLQAATIGLLLRDEQQTEEIARNPAQFYEKNKILGQHPSVGAVRSYFVGYALASTAVTVFLPERYRVFWQGTQIGIELIVTQRNRSIGIKGAF